MYCIMSLIMEEQQAPLLDQPDQQVEYATFRSDDPDIELQPLLYIAGYMDVARTYDNKVALARELARYGLGMMVVKNDRKLPITHDPDTGNPDAMLTLARNSLSVIQAEGLQNTTLATAGHSQGGMVAVRTIQAAKRMGWTTFDEANVALLASAGISKEETPLSLFGRFVGTQISSHLHVDDPNSGPEVRASIATTANTGAIAFFSNPLRGGREFVELGARKIHLFELAHAVGNLALVPYGEDTLKPSRIWDSAVKELFDRPDAPENFVYMTPYVAKYEADGLPLGIRGAHHLDCINHPDRVAATIGPFLSSKPLIQDANTLGKHMYAI
jgi:pimeloyl-ACP methyl ester carboxylesterase